MIKQATTILSYFIFMMFFLPWVLNCHADELKEALDEVVEDFTESMDTKDSSKKYYVVVRSFIDKETRKPKIISKEIESNIIEAIQSRFKKQKNVVVLERDRLEAIEKEVNTETDGTHFKMNEWKKKLGVKIGAGFLITGTTSQLTKHLKIRVKMINIVTGVLLTSSSAKISWDNLDSALTHDYEVDAIQDVSIY